MRTPNGPQLSVREMLLGNPVRLRYVRRYSSCRVNHDETVAEHSYYVVLYAMMLADWYENVRPHEMVNYQILMHKAALHDLEESRTGDMPRYFKYSSPEMAQQAHESALVAMRQVANCLVDIETARYYVRSWEASKDDSLEGRIVALADFFSVVSFVIQEYSSGNRNATEHIESLDKYFETFYEEKYFAFRLLVEESREVFESTFRIRLSIEGAPNV